MYRNSPRNPRLLVALWAILLYVLFVYYALSTL